jgi:hypothetical protein
MSDSIMCYQIIDSKSLFDDVDATFDVNSDFMCDQKL